MANIFESLKTYFFDDNNKNLNNDYSTSSTSDMEVKQLTPTNDIDLSEPHNFSPRVTTKQSRENSKGTLVDDDIRSYRKIAEVPEVFSSIDEIENEVLTEDIEGNILSLVINEETSPDIKKISKQVEEEFENVLSLIDWNNNANDLFRRWFVDSKLILECVFDNKKIKNGIQSVLLLDPVGFREIKDDEGKIYYTYMDGNNKSRFNVFSKKDLEQKKVWASEQLVMVDSGWYSASYKYYIGYLKPAIKPVNNLTSIEDMMMIYRANRASEKRVWNINIGKMSKQTAENYIQKTINNLKSRKLYNHDTGELVGESAIEAITEDWVFPTRNGRADTSVDTVRGDTSFTESVEDHKIFLKKVYQALRIPVTRLEEDSTMDFTADDILRSEMKFLKYTEKLRRRFSNMFKELLKRQLISKNICTTEDWANTVLPALHFKWTSSNEIVERAKIQNIQNRVEAVEDLKTAEVIPDIGYIFSKDWVLSNIMGLTDKQIEELQKDIDDETGENKETE